MGYSQSNDTPGLTETTSDDQVASQSDANYDSCPRSTDWDNVSIDAIVELEMMKESVEHFLVENLEKLGRLLNLESRHNGRDNGTLSEEVSKLVTVLSNEIEEYENDDDEEPYVCPLMSDADELYDYWDISTGGLVWAPPSARLSTQQQGTTYSRVQRETVSNVPQKIKLHSPTLEDILEEDEEDKDDSDDEELEAGESLPGLSRARGSSSLETLSDASLETCGDDSLSRLLSDKDEDAVDTETRSAKDKEESASSSLVSKETSSALVDNCASGSNTLQTRSDKTAPTDREIEMCSISSSLETCVDGSPSLQDLSSEVVSDEYEKTDNSSAEENSSMAIQRLSDVLASAIITGALQCFLEQTSPVTDVCCKCASLGDSTSSGSSITIYEQPTVGKRASTMPHEQCLPLGEEIEDENADQGTKITAAGDPTTAIGQLAQTLASTILADVVQMISKTSETSEGEGYGKSFPLEERVRNISSCMTNHGQPTLGVTLGSTPTLQCLASGEGDTILSVAAGETSVDTGTPPNPKGESSELLSLAVATSAIGTPVASESKNKGPPETPASTVLPGALQQLPTSPPAEVQTTDEDRQHEHSKPKSMSLPSFQSVNDPNKACQKSRKGVSFSSPLVTTARGPSPLEVSTSKTTTVESLPSQMKTQGKQTLPAQDTRKYYANIDDGDIVFRSRSGKMIDISPIASDTPPEKVKISSQNSESDGSEKPTAKVSTDIGSVQSDTNSNEEDIASEIKILIGEVVNLRGGNRATQLAFPARREDTKKVVQKNTDFARDPATQSTNESTHSHSPDHCLNSEDLSPLSTKPNPGLIYTSNPPRKNIRFDDLLQPGSDFGTGSSAKSSFPSRVCCGSGLCRACPQCRADKRKHVNPRSRVDSMGTSSCNSVNGEYLCASCKTRFGNTADGDRSDSKEKVIWVRLSDVSLDADDSVSTHTPINQAGARTCAADSTKSGDGTMRELSQVSSGPGMTEVAGGKKMSADSQAEKTMLLPDQSSKRSAVIKSSTASSKPSPPLASKYKLKANSSPGGFLLPSRFKNVAKSEPLLGKAKATNRSNEPKKTDRRRELMSKPKHPAESSQLNESHSGKKGRQSSRRPQARSIADSDCGSMPAIPCLGDTPCGQEQAHSVPTIPLSGDGDRYDVTTLVKKGHNETIENARPTTSQGERVAPQPTEYVRRHRTVTNTQSDVVSGQDPQLVPILSATRASESDSYGQKRINGKPSGQTSVAVPERPYTGTVNRTVYPAPPLTSQALKKCGNQTLAPRDGCVTAEPGRTKSEPNRLPPLVPHNKFSSLPIFPHTTLCEGYDVEAWLRANSDQLGRTASANDEETSIGATSVSFNRPASGRSPGVTHQPSGFKTTRDTYISSKQASVTNEGLSHNVLSLPRKCKSETITDRLPPLATPPGTFSSLPKLNLTSDGEGYDAGAWIRANRDRVKQITKGETSSLSPLSMSAAVSMVKNPIEEARADLKKRASVTDKDYSGRSVPVNDSASRSTCDATTDLTYTKSGEVFQHEDLLPPVTSGSKKRNTVRAKSAHQPRIRATQSSGGLPRITTSQKKIDHSLSSTY